jgi:hypothetical protein
MTPLQAKEYILARVNIDRADIADAKTFLATLSGIFAVNDVATRRANDVVGPPEQTLPLWQDDPTPAIDRYIAHLRARLAVFKAASELVASGIVMQAGANVTGSITTPWTDAPPRGGGTSASFNLDFIYAHPEHVVRPVWVKDDVVLGDGDLYLSTLGASQLHSGIADALRQSVRCCSSGLFVPAVAMLDAASEGAWIEAGKRLSTVPPHDARQASLSTVLNDPSKSMRSKAGAICDYYDGRKDLQLITRIAKPQLRDTLQWSGLIRDARNVLHWNVTASIPNDYSTVATYLLAAIGHIKRLHALASI